jgi:SAM-dependent methyltransferase
VRNNHGLARCIRETLDLAYSYFTDLHGEALEQLQLMTSSTCRACQGEYLSPLINFGNHPIAHRFVTDPSADEYVHPVNLYYCSRCGLLQLIDPIAPEELYRNYTVLSSWKPEPHIPRLIQQLSTMLRLEKNSLIIEAGSNDGVFLKALANAGWHNAFGVEPAGDAVRSAEQRGVRTIHTYFNPEIAARLVNDHGQCRLFVARQVLEHITDLRSFSEAIQIVLQPGGYVLIEVPNAGMTLSTPDYSSIWEEHVNYFTLQSLTYFLAERGIRVLHDETSVFSGEILTVIGQYIGNDQAPSSPGYLRDLESRAFSFRDHWPNFRAELCKYLHEHQLRGGRTAIYGAGCRACSLINFTGINRYIEFVVDDQEGKQGKLLPGSHLPIHASEDLDRASVNLCLLAVNTENEAKVIAKHQAYQAAGGRFFSVLPPSDRLLPVWQAMGDANS